MYYVYAIQSKKYKKIYVGYTNNLQKRFKMHNSGKIFSTKPYKPFELIYYEAYRNEKDAKNREKKLKQRGQTIRRLKERLQYSLKA